MKIIDIDEFMEEAKKRFGPDKKKWKFVCPVCKTAQTAYDLLAVGVQKDKISEYIGFSCIGRWTDAGSFYDKKRSPIAVGCDWTLGGLLRIHEIEIRKKDGSTFPIFDLAES